jgi:hypothetical protein
LNSTVFTALGNSQRLEFFRLKGSNQGCSVSMAVPFP